MSTVNRKAHRINISLVIQRQYLKILLLGTLSFLVVAPMLYFGTHPTYSTVVQLRIDPSASVVPGFESGSVGNFYNEYVATQKFKILKRQNVEKALSLLTPTQREQVLNGMPMGDYAQQSLINSIVINPSYDSLIMTVTMTREAPEGMTEFLNALINVYLEQLQSEKGTMEMSRISFSDSQRNELETKIAALTAQLKQISEEISTGNFQSNDIPFKIESQIQEETAIKAENDRLLKEKKYNDFVKNMYKSSTSGMDALIETRISSDTYLNDQKRVISSKIDSLNNQLNALSSQNAGRKELEEGISRLLGQMADLEAKAREKYKKLIESENTGLLEKQKSSLYSDYVVAKEFEDAVKKSLASAKEKYSYISKRVLVAQGLEKDLGDLKNQLAKVNDTRNQLLGEQKTSSGFVVVENYAKPPMAPDGSTLTKSLLIAFIASFLWVVGAVFLFEILDQRIKSTVELKSFTGIKPSWPISHYPDSILNVSLQDRESVVYKAIQSLATRINQERQNFQAKVVTFTGIHSWTGATEILINCAHAMTDNCEKILVVDFNVNRPGIAAKMGISLKSQPAVKNLETAPLESVVYSDLARGIDLLTIRNLDKLENKVVDRVLELAKERYDMVFIDGAPLLSSSSTEHLFMQSDAAVFVVRGNVTTYRDLQHTMELAGKFGINSAALVLNWWKSDKKGLKDTEDVTPKS